MLVCKFCNWIHVFVISPQWCSRNWRRKWRLSTWRSSVCSVTKGLHASCSRHVSTSCAALYVPTRTVTSAQSAVQRDNLGMITSLLWIVTLKTRIRVLIQISQPSHCFLIFILFVSIVLVGSLNPVRIRECFLGAALSTIAVHSALFASSQIRLCTGLYWNAN